MKDAPILLAALLLGAPLAAQADPSPLDRLPRDATNLLLVRDPLPHLDALLASPALREAALATADLQQELMDGFTLDPVRLARMLQPFRDFVPTEIAVATSPGSAHELARAISAGMRAALLLTGAGHFEAEDRAALAGGIDATLRELRLPQVTAWARFRTDRTPARLFDQLLDALPELPGLTATAKDDRIEFVLDWARLQDGEPLAELKQAGIDPAPFAGLTLHATLVQQGDMLRFDLGTPAAGPLPAAALGAMWRTDGKQLLFAHVDCEAAMAELDALADLMDELEVPPALEALKVSLDGNLQRLAQVGGLRSTSIVVDGGVVITTEEDLGVVAAHAPIEQPPEALRRSILPTDGPFALIGMPLDLMLGATAAELYSRLASRASRPGGMAAVSQLEQRAGELFEFLASEESSVFEPGVAIVSRATTPATASGGESLPVGTVAFLAQTESADAGLGFSRRFGTLLSEALGIDGDGAVVEADLGLGVPTLAVNLPPIPGVAMPPSWRPHFAQRDGLWILSTDTEWTRTLLARVDAANADGSPSLAANAIAWQSCRGGHLAAMLEGARAWGAAMGFSGKAGDAVLRTLSALVAQVESFDSHTTFEGTILRDQTTLKLRQPDAK